MFEKVVKKCLVRTFSLKRDIRLRLTFRQESSTVLGDHTKHAKNPNFRKSLHVFVWSDYLLSTPSSVGHDSNRLFALSVSGNDGGKAK